jgi:hypothetical protein
MPKKPKNQKRQKSTDFIFDKKTKKESICNKLPNALKTDLSVTCVLAPRFT